jgi:hypothetical protein
MASPMSRVASCVASIKSARPADRFLDQRTHLRRRKFPIGLLREVAGRLLEGVDQRIGAPGPHARNGVGRAGREHVAAQDQVGLAGGNALRLQRVLSARDAHVRGDRAVLLRHARHVQHTHALAFEVRRHADQRADGDDAGAADAGDEDVVDPSSGKLGGSGSGRLFGGGFGRDGCVLARLHAVDRHEARAEALDAGIVGVAGTLVHAALQAQVAGLGLQRRAVRLLAAVAAAFAHRVVDEHALGGLGNSPFLRRRRFSARTDLVVDQHRHALELAQLALHRVHVVAVMHREHDALAVGRQEAAVGPAVGSSATSAMTLHAFGRHLVRDARHADGPSTGWPPVMATASL